MSEPSLKKNFVLSTIYQVLLLIVPFITAPYVSRVLTADGIGIYSFTNSIQMYFVMFAALGTVSYGAREIARNRNDKVERSRLFWEIELLTVLTTVLCLIAYGLFILITNDYKLYYLILAINLLAVMLDVSWFYTGIEQLKYTVGPNGIFKIIGVVLIFIFVRTKDDLAIYILIMTMVTFLGNATMWVFLPKYILRIQIKDLSIKKHFKETLVYFVPTIATSIYTILDKTLIGLITTDTSENGYYEQATKIVNMAKSLTFTALNTLLGARISFLFAENRIDEIKDRIKASVDYILFMGVGICLGIIGVAPRFVPVFFGDGYEPVINLLYWLSPIILIIGISNCLGAQYYNPAGLRALSAKFIIVGSIVNLVLNLCLIPIFRSTGAVIATLTAEMVISIFYMHYCKGFLHIKTILNLGWKKVIAGFVMLLIIRVFSKLIQDDLLACCVEIFVGLCVYCLLLALLKDSFIKVGLNMIRDRKTKIRG